MGKNSKIKGFVFLFIDIILINLAYVLSFYIRFTSLVPKEYIQAYLKFVPLIILVYIILFYIMKFYSNNWHRAGLDEYLQGVIACTLGTILNMIIMFIVPLRVPNLVTAISGVFITILCLGYRVSFRAYNRLQIYTDLRNKEGKDNMLIIGAGSCAQLIISEVKKNNLLKYNIVGLVDDDLTKLGTYLNGYKVLGSTNEIHNIVSNKKVNTVLLAIPSINANDKKKLINLCQEIGVKVKIMPDISEVIDNDLDVKKIRDVDLRDLLGREEVKLDKTGISEYITNKVILVSGGGGSIGSELCRQIAKFTPKKLIILDIYENNAYDLQTELQRKIPSLNQDVVIASIRDKNKIEAVFKEYRPNVVFHAAAHKHVPLMEFNPTEAIKNNVIGTMNVAEMASKYCSEKFVLISTDKAVNPTNVMGATKRLCEMIVQSINEKSKTDFVAVRFGNVLGSNGSVIPLFKKQIAEGGPITLTHKDITRYFMLIPEAAQLVLQAGAFANGGEIFVLDMGKPVKIYDLAVDLIRLSGLVPEKDIKIEVVGLRPGEKLYEELLMAENKLSETKHEKIFIEMPTVIDYDILKDKIKVLIIASNMENKEKVKYELKKIVPTYTRLDEVATTSTN
ncbi:nucleoside-diphosphate sugar epimerase/dehydratase [Clostridium tertium]|uniref:polysaccharide biosynthesis protein n=1 Tax=Clostridium tertium TaxID=1559 RepID=UPI00232B33BE|nr:nucleoside-diphosphate sugar epimerase/dehydratase [Clostridium tertium]MDB1921726.1 nucleoside-diphosphate sugar epimerase/dehydratase [Clostridium tertium]MDB1924929.1 nucleoside-diphosphate sugar epimerase/dehydratase [Clostridium tertium]MDB1929568.1 nucleoside-diphosphate sugar epimerase/dehydratase [Clostridium tertium]